MANNEPRFFLSGKNGQLAVYDNRLVITRKGVLGFLTHGAAGERTIPFTSITGIQMKPGGMLANGFIQFAVQGSIERRGGVMNATDDENAIVFVKSYNNTAAQIKAFIEDKIFNAPAVHVMPPIPTSAPSAADEVLKLKQLLDAGVLTQEEFDKKKKELLGL